MKKGIVESSLCNIPKGVSSGIVKKTESGEAKQISSARMDTFPKCPVCQQQFTLKGPVPYLLPCLHAVCETCVTSAAGGVISCTTCPGEINLNDTSLQKDEVRQQEIFYLTVKHRPTELLCTHENDGNQAVCWCQECEEVLCEYCQNMHSNIKSSRKHTVHNFEDITPPNLVSETNCTTHTRYPLDLFDKRCNTSICCRCLRGEHAGHEVEDLDEAALRVKQRIEQHAKDLSSLLSLQQTHLQSIRQDIKNTDRTQNTLKDTIGQTFQSLRSQLDQREKVLLTFLEARTMKTKETLHAHQTSCEDEHVRSTDVSEYIRKSLLYASKSSFLKLESSVDAVTRYYLETASPQPYDVATAVFTTDGLSKLKSDMSRYGTISVQGKIGGNKTNDKETQTGDIFATLKQQHEMELAEQKSKFASDKDRLQQLNDELNAESKNMKQELAEQKSKFASDKERLQQLNDELNAESKNMKQELAEQKSKFASDKERLQQLNDELNAESKNMKQELAEQKSKFASDKERLQQLNGELNAESNNMKQELAEQKSTFASDKEILQQLNDKLNAESKNMKQMLDEKDRSFQAAAKIIDRLETSLKRYPTGCVRLMKAVVPDICTFLDCTPVKYDKDRVNTDYVHIDTEGDLVNRKSDTRPAGEGRLKKYLGTCSTVPLSQDGCPQYWEVENRVSLDKPLTGRNLILEVGVCREEQRDVDHYIHGRPHSYCMTVSHCTTHGGICRMIGKEGKYVLCLPDTLPNTAGTSHTLHYGVVYDDARKKIVFIDVKEKKVMSTLDNVDSSEPLWPMFGVHNPSLLTVSMRLVVGSDINMTEEKKAMIVKALS